MRLSRRAGTHVLAVLAACAAWPAAAQETSPLIVVDTSKGTFSIETFPDDAPVTVAHVVALARQGFYDGQRVHRAIPGFVVQFGDPQTRDLERRDLWGRGAGAASGMPVGVVELSPRQRHRQWAVGMAHLGDPAKADSQMYVVLDDRGDLDGRYVVFGQVTAGFDVAARLEVGDDILRVRISGDGED